VVRWRCWATREVKLQNDENDDIKLSVTIEITATFDFQLETIRSQTLLP
jgi:hypothetical protein